MQLVRLKQLRSSFDQVDATVRNYNLKDLGMRDTSSGRHKIIKSSHVRMNPRTSEPWEHDGAHLLTRRDN